MLMTSSQELLLLLIVTSLCEDRGSVHITLLKLNNLVFKNVSKVKHRLCELRVMLLKKDLTV